MSVCNLPYFLNYASPVASLIWDLTKGGGGGGGGGGGHIRREGAFLRRTLNEKETAR